MPWPARSAAGGEHLRILLVALLLATGFVVVAEAPPAAASLTVKVCANASVGADVNGTPVGQSVNQCIQESPI